MVDGFPSNAFVAAPFSPIVSSLSEYTKLHLSRGIVVISDPGGVFPGVEELELTNLTASALVEHPPTGVDTIDTLA